MTVLTLVIGIVFCISYFFIANESIMNINKAANALLMFIANSTLLYSSLTTILALAGTLTDLVGFL